MTVNEEDDPARRGLSCGSWWRVKQRWGMEGFAVVKCKGFAVVKCRHGPYQPGNAATYRFCWSQ